MTKSEFTAEWDFTQTLLPVDPYLSAEALGIQSWERARLIEVMAFLKTDPETFDMRTIQNLEVCGTARCIGGWVGHLQGLSYCGTHSYVHAYCGDFETQALTELYYPAADANGNESRAYYSTGPQAAAAIHNFLLTGDPDWAAVLDV